MNRIYRISVLRAHDERAGRIVAESLQANGRAVPRGGDRAIDAEGFFVGRPISDAIGRRVSDSNAKLA